MNKNNDNDEIHNPDKVTLKELGEGYRFCTKREISIQLPKDAEFFNSCNSWRSSQYRGKLLPHIHSLYTYRTASIECNKESLAVNALCDKLEDARVLLRIHWCISESENTKIEKRIDKLANAVRKN